MPSVAASGKRSLFVQLPPTVAGFSKTPAISAHAVEHELRIPNPKQRHDLPVARVKRLMRDHSCFNPNGISTEVPELIARAVELFVLDMCAHSSIAATERGRNILQARDIKTVIERTSEYAFLQETYEECITAANMSKSDPSDALPRSI
jgi:histone H3/H4